MTSDSMLRLLQRLSANRPRTLLVVFAMFYEEGVPWSVYIEDT